MRQRVIVTALACVLLGGCMIGPDYFRPEVKTPENFRTDITDAQNTADTEWWKQFEDPVLDELITTALENNKSVQIAAANVERAAGVLGQTRSALFPQVGYGGDAVRQRFSEDLDAAPVSGIPNPDNSYQIFASASWEIDLWGRIRRQTEAAQANLMATEEARRGVVLSLVSLVATSYLQLRGLDEQLIIAKRTLSTYDESVKLFKLQFKYGVVSQITVEQSLSQYETAAAAIPLIELAIAQTENGLSILLGRDPGPIARGKPITELVSPAIPAGLPSALLEQRPDILQAEQELIAANAQIGAAKALYFPTISLTALFGGASSALSGLFSGPAKLWSYAGSVTGPIFTGGSISSQVTQAEAAHQASLVRYQAVIQNAFRDVDDALSARVNLRKQLDAQERLVKALGEYTRLARLQYNEGYVPYSTVLQAEQDLFPAELNIAQIRAGLLASNAAIYRAMGGGWVTEATHIADQPQLQSESAAESAQPEN
jgi:outer membrane protein, multidrug efflux system